MDTSVSTVSAERPQRDSSHVKHTNYGILEFAFLIDVKQLPSTQGEDHALVIFLKVVVDLCSN